MTERLKQARELYTDILDQAAEISNVLENGIEVLGEEIRMSG